MRSSREHIPPAATRQQTVLLRGGGGCVLPAAVKAVPHISAAAALSTTAMSTMPVVVSALLYGSIWNLISFDLNLFANILRLRRSCATSCPVALENAVESVNWYQSGNQL